MKIARLPALVVLAVAVVVLAACGGGGDDDQQPSSSTAPSGDDSPAIEAETTYDVTYTDGTSVIEDDALEGFVSIEKDASGGGQTVRFDGASEEVRNLNEGDVVIFAGQGMGKVESVETNGDETVVELGEAMLNEAIKDGEVGFSYPIRWNELPQEYYTDPQELVSRNPTQEQSGLKFSGTVQGWELEYELKPTAERLEMKVEAKYHNAMKVSGEGWINNYTQETFIQFEDSKLGEVTSRSIGLEGEMELKWSALGQGNPNQTEVVSFSVPVGLTFPIPVGALVFTGTIKAVLQVVPELRVDGASSGGSWKVHYSSDQGFVVDNTLSNPYGSLKSKDIGVSGETVSAGFGVVAFALGIEFPRFELGLFGSTAMGFITIKTYSTSEWTPGTTLTSDIPPCQKGSTTIQAVAGYKLSLLGGIGVEGTTPIWKDFFEKFKDDEPCTLTGD